jgi:hypothetical protein
MSYQSYLNSLKLASATLSKFAVVMLASATLAVVMLASATFSVVTALLHQLSATFAVETALLVRLALTYVAIPDMCTLTLDVVEAS